MNLLDLYAPLFQCICRLNRLGRLVGPADYAATLAEISGLLEEIARNAATDGRLADQARRLELPILFFIDSLISESKLSCAAQWDQNRLAFAREEMTGDQKFFDLLEETFRDGSEDASERLAVFHTCLGLGFTGFYAGDPDHLRRLMDRLAPRVQRWMDTDARVRICPEAYQHVNLSDLTEKPSRRLFIVGLIFSCFTVAVVFTYVWMFRYASKDMYDAIGKILEYDSR